MVVVAHSPGYARRLDNIATSGHHKAMLSAKISQLKDALSHYLKRVQGGEEVLIMDRDRPVARIVAYGEDTLVCRLPRSVLAKSFFRAARAGKAAGVLKAVMAEREQSPW